MHATALTKAQQEAVEKAYELLSEHFDHALIMVGGEHHTESGKSFSRGYWSGGYLAALGATMEAQRMIQYSQTSDTAP